MTDTFNNFTCGALVDEIRSRNSIAGAAPRHETESAVSRVFDAIKSLTDRGDKVTVRHFGTFQVKERAGGTGKNPRTGETITYGPKKALKFKASEKN